MRLIFSILTVIIPFFVFADDKTKYIDLHPYEKQIYSQNGEDGVLDKIFQLLKIQKGYCVEFGAADGIWFSNTLNLRNQDWTCLLLSGADENLDINLHREWITPDNIVSIFKKYSVPKDVDLVSIDIDSMDWYVWRALGKVYKPKVILIEYNQNFGRYHDYVVGYNPNYRWDGVDLYYGASLLAYYHLGKHLGYTLVYAEQNGLNAFFIRDDLLKYYNLSFRNAGDVRRLYRGCTDLNGKLLLKNHPFYHAVDLLKTE